MRMAKALGSNQIEVYLYDTKSKQLTPVVGQNETKEYEVAFGAKPGQILVLSDKPSDFKRVYTLEAGKLVPITPDIKHDIGGFSIDESRTRIYYSINEDGYKRRQSLGSLSVFRGRADFVFYKRDLFRPEMRKMTLVVRRSEQAFKFTWNFADRLATN